MTRRSRLAGLLGGVALAVLLALPVLAHSEGGGSGISVEPDSAQAGDTVVLAGTGLEANSDRVLVLAGPDITIDIGKVTTDAQGMFEQTIRIPIHLPTGRYEFRAIGDETLTAAVGITAAPGMGASASESSSADESVVAHHPQLLTEVAVIGAGLAVLLLGIFLVWKAERFGHPSEPTAA